MEQTKKRRETNVVSVETLPNQFCPSPFLNGACFYLLLSLWRHFCSSLNMASALVVPAVTGGAAPGAKPQQTQKGIFSASPSGGTQFGIVTMATFTIFVHELSLTILNNIA
jgi:hypothetical protein